MPSASPFLDPLQHRVEERPSWLLGAEGLLVAIDDFDAGLTGDQPLDFVGLRGERHDLTVFGLLRFAAVDEVFHTVSEG